MGEHAKGRCLVIQPVLRNLLVYAGPPCWDDVSRAVKYQSRHVVAGNVGLFMPSDKNETHSLHVDGLHVSAKLTEISFGEMVELSVTNCSPSTVQIVRNTYDLVVNGPGATAPIADVDVARDIHGETRWIIWGCTCHAAASHWRDCVAKSIVSTRPWNRQ
jgi:hypothetical protein